jgi:inhibitor of KinA
VNSFSLDLVRVAAAGDSALVAEFPQRIDPDINQRALALAARLRGEWGEILRDVVIGYCTVTVYFNPRHVDARWLEGEIRVAARDVARDAENGERPAARTIEVPVCYDLAVGPDLEDVAAFGACSVEHVIELHANRTYRVYVVGFVPGFAYLAEVDQRIARPRRTTPRTAVPAGSVAIAGGQTGIYPKVTPGGWNIIGRTPLKPYDPERDDPFLFRVGDDVRFTPMTLEAFERSAG